MNIVRRTGQARDRLFILIMDTTQMNYLTAH